MTEKRLHICLISEGSYPYVIGGTGAWTQQLIQTLPDMDFTIVAISASARKSSERRYPTLPNIRQIIDVALDDDSIVRQGMRRPHRSGRQLRRTWETMGRTYRAIMRDEYDQFASLYGVVRRELSVRDLFQSFEHWHLVEHYYRMLTPIEPFMDFYYTWRFTHLVLYRLMRMDLPVADVYHPIASGFAGFAGVCGKLLRGGGLIVTEHGLYTRERELEISSSDWFRGYQKDFLTGLFDKINRLVYTSSDAIVSLFEDARAAQVKLGAPADRTVVIPNGVDSAHLSGIPRGADHDDVIRIGLVGRVVPVKDVRAFIESAKIVAETVPSAEFHIIGPVDEEPDYAESCRELVRQLQLEDRVRFTGYQRPEEYLPSLDIVALTSLKEAQPFSILEAMACGIPVVATRTGSLPELLDEVGRLVWPRDVQGFAEAMIELARDRDLRRRLGAAGQERVRTRYDQRANLEQYRTWYTTLASRTAARLADTGASR